MNNIQVKNDRQKKSNSKESLRGETPQKHGIKRKKTRKINPETVAARKILIAMSQKAQDMMEMPGNDIHFEGCKKINDYLLVMHKKDTGCEQFKTFYDWKKEGYKIKKGAKSKRVWGSPLKAKKQGEEKQAKGVPETESKSDVEKTFKFWPMCSLFSENQVELIEDSPEPTPTKPSKNAEKPQAEVVNNDIEEEQGNEEDTLCELSPFVTVDFNEQQEARKNRMLERADKASIEFQINYNCAKDMATAIPFGQPILVGHHSEQRDRNYRNKVHNKFNKAFELDSKAIHYRQKAASVGKCGIASNDPQAIEKLKNKLARLELNHNKMKKVNKIIRDEQLTDEEKADKIMAAEFLSGTQTDKILKPDNSGPVGFALSNNNAEINRIKKRINSIEKLRNSDSIEFKNDNFSIAVENGRVCIEFSNGKPSDYGGLRPFPRKVHSSSECQK